MRTNVTFFFRSSTRGFHSIERVFQTLEQHLSAVLDIRKRYLPKFDHKPSSLLKNFKYAKQQTSEINHITGHINYIALVTGKNSVLTIHDMKSALKGNVIRRSLILVFWFWLPALLVKRITVISEQTKKEVLKYMPFARRKIVKIHNPVNEIYVYHPKQSNTKNPNILCVGTKPNKNLERIFKALQDVDCHITIMGKPTPSQEQYLSDNNISYAYLDNLSNEDVLKAYIDADILCFPSTYEGFGMPIIEAQAVGRPVLTSNFGAMKEVANDAAHFVNPYDYQDIKTGILKLINDIEYRETLIAKGLKNVERFKPESIAQEYINVYKALLN